MKRLLSALLILLIIITNANAATIFRNETVYVTLDPQGKPQKTEVITWLRTNGKGPSHDLNDLREVKNIHGPAAPASTGGVLTFAAPARDIFFSGTTKKQLPVALDIKYRLNGRTVPRRALEGKSGRLEIVINIKNRTGVPREFTYRQVGTGETKAAREEIPVPFVVMVSTDLDIGRFNNVSAPDGAFAVIGRTMKMNWVAFPYPETTIKLTADIEKVRMPAILFTMIPKYPPLPEIEIESKLNEIYAGADKLGTYLVQLKDGAAQMTSGHEQLIAALQQVDEGTGQLIQAGNAQVEITEGAIKINEGMAEKVAPLARVPFFSGAANQAGHYLDIQRQLLELVAHGGPISDDILEFIKEQGKEAPPVKEFPGIKITTGGIAQLNDGSRQMLDGVRKLECGSRQLVAALEQMKIQGTDAMKQGILTGADPMVRQLAALQVAKDLVRHYDRFTGRPSRVKSSVEFIMKTPD